MKEIISINIEKNLLKKIDKLKGDIPRSKFISNCLKEYFKKMKGGKTK